MSCETNLSAKSLVTYTFPKKLLPPCSLYQITANTPSLILPLSVTFLMESCPGQFISQSHMGSKLALCATFVALCWQMTRSCRTYSYLPTNFNSTSFLRTVMYPILQKGLGKVTFFVKTCDQYRHHLCWAREEGMLGYCVAN